MLQLSIAMITSLSLIKTLHFNTSLDSHWYIHCTSKKNSGSPQVKFPKFVFLNSEKIYPYKQCYKLWAYSQTSLPKAI